MCTFKRSGLIRLPLTLTAAPTGTPQVAIFSSLIVNDLASNGAGTGISSVTGGFEAGMIGARINISGGTGFTPGNYAVTAYTDTNNITIGTSCGANATGGTGKVNNKTILAATNMTEGASTLDWYYDYITASDAAVGAYQIKYSAVVSGTTYYAYGNYQVSIANLDAIKADTETIIANIGVSAGARAIIFNVTDGTAPIINVKLSVHNSNNDDTPLFGILTTNALANTGTINLDDGTYKVRVSKAGSIVSAIKTATVTASATINYTVVATTITPPADPELCKIIIYAITLGNVAATGLTINIISDENFTKVGSQYVKHASLPFSYDAVNGYYHFTALRGVDVEITCTEKLGFNHAVTVPDQATYVLSLSV